jgi:nucleotide-binding universal stress UspA family protein
MKTILVATDGSDNAQQAVGVAIELANDSGAELVVTTIRVMPPIGRGGASGPILAVEDPAATRAIAADAAAHAVEAGLKARAEARAGDPADEIVRLAGEIKADMVVVGTRGLGAISGALMGSVSRSVVRHAGVPVTVVHARDHATV